MLKKNFFRTTTFEIWHDGPFISFEHEKMKLAFAFYTDSNFSEVYNWSSIMDNTVEKLMKKLFTEFLYTHQSQLENIIRRDLY